MSRVTHGSHIYVSCHASMAHTYKCVVSRISTLWRDSYHTYQWVMSHSTNYGCDMPRWYVWHDSLMCDMGATSCHASRRCDMIRTTHMNESCHTYQRVMSHTSTSHVTHINESCHTYQQSNVTSAMLPQPPHQHTTLHCNTLQHTAAHCNTQPVDWLIYDIWVWHDSLTCVTWAWHDSSICVTWVWHDWLMCVTQVWVTRLYVWHECDVTCWYMWHGCDMTRWYV